jgi:tight adherence protein C
MDLSVLLIVGLVSGSAAVLGVALVALLDRSPGNEAPVLVERKAGKGMQALTDVLRLVPVPSGIRRRWETSHAEQQVMHTGLPWQINDYAALRWIALWLGIIIGCTIAALRNWDLMGQFLALVIILAGLLTPEVLLRRRIDQRQMETDLSLPYFLDRLALGLESGLGFEIALRRTAADFSGLLGEELRRLVRQLDRGHGRAEALDELSERIPSQDLRSFSAAVKQADRLGTSLAKTLRVQTGLLRARRKRRAQEASRRLPILIVFPLVFFFLPSLLIIYLAPPLLHLFLGR